MAKRRRGINPDDLTTATAEAEAKYGPEISTVRGLIDQAKAQYEGDVSAAKTNASAVRSYAHQAGPKVKQIYTRATGAADAAGDDVVRAFGGLGAAADVFRAATAREQGGQRGRIAEAQADARQSLIDRGTEAQAGQAMAINEARRGYRGNLTTLSDQLSDIAGQQGADIVARLGSLRSERAERAKDKAIARTNAESRASEGAANRASHEGIAEANRIAAAERAAAGRAPGGTKRATQTRIEAISGEFQEALRFAKDYVDEAHSKAARARAADDLVRGRVPGTDPSLVSKSNPKGSYGATPKFKQLVASIALDQAFDGHVSRANARKLHELGYKLSDITGATSYEDYKKRVASQTLDRLPGKG